MFELLTPAPLALSTTISFHRDAAAPRPPRDRKLMSYPKSILTALFTLPLVVALPACGDKKEETKEDGDKADAKPKVEKKDPSTLFAGSNVSMPEPYGKLVPGMTLEEAKKVFPELPEDGTIKTEAYPDIWFQADFDDETKVLRRVYFSVPMKQDEAAELVKKTWGEFKEGEELGKKVMWWFNPEAKLRASVEEGFGDETKIEITRYLPVAEFLGEDKELAFQKDAPLLGLTVADLESKYPDFIKKESAEDAAKTKAGIAKMAGDDAAAMMGKPEASVDLEYPPTEWASFWTPIHLSWSDEGKIEYFWFGVDFRPHPAAKDEIMALLKKKWGEPKEEEDLGRKMFVFSEDPRIEVKEDTITNKWDIRVEPAGS